MLAQIISLLTIPIITRIYPPIEYGIFSTCFAFIFILIPISGWVYNRAIILPDDELTAKTLFFLTLLCVVTSSILIGALIFLVSILDLGSRFVFFSQFQSYLWYLPIWLLLEGLMLSTIFLSLRHEKFKNIAVGRVTQAILDRSIVIGLGYLIHPGVIGLIAGRIIGVFSTTIYLLRNTVFAKNDSLFRHLSFKKMIKQASFYKKFPLYSGPGIFLTSFSLQMPILFFGAVFSPQIVGFYAICSRVFNLPMNVIAGSVGRVFYQKAARLHDNIGKLKNDSIRLLEYMIYILTPLLITLAFYGQDLFRLVFGSEWIIAGQYAQILSLSLWGMFLYRPFSILFDVFQKQQQMFFLDIASLVFRILGIGLGAYFWKSAYSALWGLSIATISLRLFSLYCAFNLIEVDAKHLTMIFLKKALELTPFAMFVIVINMTLDGQLVSSLLGLVAGLFIQAGIILFCRPEIKKDLISIFGR